MISMESRHGSDIQAQATADRDAAFGQSESASQLALNQDDLDEINAVDVTAPVAAVARVLELSEEVQDRIAADNDALTDSFAAQAMEQSDPDETNTVPRNQNQARIGAVAVAGCIVSAVLIAVVRRFRRGRNKSSEKSSQRISGSTRGSRQGAGSVKSGGSHGLKGSTARSQSRRGAGSSTSLRAARRGEARSDAARARPDRAAADRTTAETAASKAVGRNASASDVRSSAARASAVPPAPAVQAPPARKKRVPPLLSGNKARSRSDKDSESDKPMSASSTAASKGSPASTAQERASAPDGLNGMAPQALPTFKPAGTHAAAASALPRVQLNANAQEFHPCNSGGPGPAAATDETRSAAVEDTSVPSIIVEKPSSASVNGHDEQSAAAQAEQPEPELVDNPRVEPDVLRSDSQIEKMKFNVDAPAFRPSSAVKKPTQGTSAASVVDTEKPHSSSGESEVEVQQLPRDLLRDARDTEVTVANRSGPEEVSLAAEEGDDQDLEFMHRTLELAGKDIAADAEETPDEKVAAQQLLELARELQRMGGGRATPAELQDKGLKELKQDVAFCMSHQCRPLKVAEHASTAADFFFQLQSFDAAEEMLDVGVQAARMAGDASLETTLMHNLATSLRKRGKYNMALRLHHTYKADIEEREGITSEYVVLARHSIVDILTTRGRGEECRAYLDDEVAKLEEHLATLKAGVEAVGTRVSEDSGNAKIARALQAIARCKMDYAKHFETSERQDDAIAMGRDALARHRAAAEIDPSMTVPMYANFLAVQLRVKGHRLKSEGQQEEAMALYCESKDMFVELAAIVESQEIQGRKNRRLPMVYRQIADICMDLNDFESAFKATDQFASSVMSVYQCRPSDPTMQQVWEFKAGIHAAAGDAEGAANARKQALKCKSSLARARGSHKGKQRKDARG